MKGESYLLDTDVCVELINSPLPSAEWLEGSEVSISAISAYELAVGMEKCRSRQTKAETRDFLEAVEILEFSKEAACESARVRAELEIRGEGIGPYDTQIAGHCRLLGRVLVSNNQREFGRVKGLRTREFS